MFNLVRKAIEKTERQAKEIREPVIDDLRQLLLHVTYEIGLAHGYMNDEAKNKALMDKSGKIVLGFEAVRMGAHPIEISDPLISGAATLAHAAVNKAILTSKLNMEKIAGDLRYLLGFSPDGSEIRQNPIA